MNEIPQYYLQTSQRSKVLISLILNHLIFLNTYSQFYLKVTLIFIGIAFFSNIYTQQNTTFDSKTNMYYAVSTTQNHTFSYQNPLPPLFNWQMVQSPIIYFNIDICFVDLLNGWTTNSNGGILRTTDGGFNWSHTLIIPGGSLSGVHFINKDTGWICGQVKTIRKSVDGGQNWIIQDFPQFALPFYYDVFFNNINTGYCVGSESASKGYVVKTTNSGVNWQQIFLAVQPNTTIYGQYWISNDTGWFFGSSIFMKTTNGGLNFIDYYPNIPPTSNGFNGLLGLCFVNQQTGWISGSNVDHKNIYKTTDGGLSWVFQDNPVTQYQFAQLDDIIFIDENRGWAGGYSGQLITTTNGGTNWLTDVSEPTWFECFDNYGSNKVWCGAKWGEVWYLDEIPPVSIQSNSTEIPKTFFLKQNYPNPFNNQTIIEFGIPKSERLIIKIYDLQGKEIKELINKTLDAGSHSISYNADKLASGIYFYTMKTEKIIKTRKFILVR